MATKSKFPNTIAVSVENEGTDDEFLTVNMAASDAAQVFQAVPVAIYKLVDVGVVTCQSQFIPKKRRRS